MTQKLEPKFKIIRSPSTTLIPKQVGLPNEKWVRFRYVQEIGIDAGLAGMGSRYFRANSLFDPDEAIGGHQPLNYDQLIFGYKNYTVYGAKLTMTYLKPISTSSVPGYYGIFIDDDNALTYTTAPAIIESNQRGSKWKSTMGIEYTDRSVTAGFSAKKFFGVTNLDALVFGAPKGGNPAKPAFFCCWVGSIAGNDPANANFLVQIEYLAKLTEKVFIDQS